MIKRRVLFNLYLTFDKSFFISAGKIYRFKIIFFIDTFRVYIESNFIYNLFASLYQKTITIYYNMI